MERQIVPIDRALYIDILNYLPTKWSNNITTYDGKQHGVDVSYIIRNGGTNTISMDCGVKYRSKTYLLFWLLYVGLLAFATFLYLQLNMTYVFISTVVIILSLELYSLTMRTLQLEKCKYANSIIKEISFCIIRHCDSETIVSERDKNSKLDDIVNKLLVDVNSLKDEHIKLYQFLSENDPALAIQFINTVSGMPPIETNNIFYSNNIH